MSTNNITRKIRINAPRDYDKINDEYEKLNCKDANTYSKECNAFLKKNELDDRSYFKSNPTANSHLYPNTNDPNFNIKIATKKEFNDTKYDGAIYADVKKYANEVSVAEFEISPHQSFVRNFLSFQTPYNSLLLYHGLGSGKTCSAIGVSEDMREYLKQVGITKRIIIVASENVQENFKLQLFDERNLKNVDGVWVIKGCIGNRLLKEVNPTNLKEMTRDKIITQIKSIISASYIFMGYGQLANYIIKTSDVPEGSYKNENEKGKRVKRKLMNEFNSRLIIIDEIHNIRMTEDNENKKVGVNLELLVKSAENMRLLLLSATPMYNTYKEITWLINLMNVNDRRSSIELKDIFDSSGNFKKEGRDILIRKATGYVSFVRGENPYTFPYRIYPEDFSITNTFSRTGYEYPSYQMNGKIIEKTDALRIFKLYLQPIGVYQSVVYKYIIKWLKQKNMNVTNKKGELRVMPTFENMDSFGYTILQKPLETLIMCYPYEGLDLTSYETEESVSPSSDVSSQETLVGGSETPSVSLSDSSSSSIEASVLKFDPSELTGKKGLSRTMHYTDSKSPPFKGGFNYKPDTINKYGRVFSADEIGKYSTKLKSILNSIVSPVTAHVSDGLILIYSQYIDGGLIPTALALEEMGITRHGSKSLFKNSSISPVDVRTMKPKNQNTFTDFKPAKYTMITGDPRLSPNNVSDINTITNVNNKDGDIIKIILISKAGSEGIDFKYIRQVHILEPWYNISQVEQIIGRAVRNLSHKELEFEKRNVQIFMYGTILENSKEESADLYVFRLAELKAKQIGHVSRALKESAVDCIINHDQTMFTQENFNLKITTPITQILSTGITLEKFKIGDIPYSATCDYMETCDYTCNPTTTITDADINVDTYSEQFATTNSEKIIQKIRSLMKERFFYKKQLLFDLIDVPKKYQLVQKYSALTQLLDDKNELITDKYGRSGRLVNIGEYYLFQPLEIKDTSISSFDRSVPADYKPKSILFNANPNQEILKHVIDKKNVVVSEETERIQEHEKPQIIAEMNAKYNLSFEYKNKLIKITRGDSDWYKHCGFMMYVLVKNNSIIQEEDLKMLLVDHIVESLVFADKLKVLNYVYSLSVIQEYSFDWLVKEHFKKLTVSLSLSGGNNMITCILLYDKNKKKDKGCVYIYNAETRAWTESEPEDRDEILSLQVIGDAWIIKKEELNTIVGFVDYENKNQYLVFKIKNTVSSRNTGARCDEAGKQKTINNLNGMFGDERFTKENTKVFTQVDLCILEEFLMRYYQKVKKNGKSWFVNVDVALFNNF